MANPYELFKTDEKMEAEQGVVLDYGDFRIRIARAGGANKKFSKMYEARTKSFRRQMETETLPEEVANRLMVELYVDAVVLGMTVKDKDGKFVDGIYDAEGNILEYNRRNAIDIFMNLPELFRDIQVQANKISLFRAEELEKDAKNS